MGLPVYFPEDWRLAKFEVFFKLKILKIWLLSFEDSIVLSFFAPGSLFDVVTEDLNTVYL